MLRCCLVLLFLLGAGSCFGSGFDFRPPGRSVNLFESAGGGEDDASASLDGMIERSSWRNISIEGYNGLVAARQSNWSGGLGVSFGVWKAVSISIRTEFNMQLGAVRDNRPQTRALMLEPTVRLHLDFHEHVALFSNHGPSVSARFDYYRLDDRVSDNDLGRVTSIGVGTVNTVGLEFGNDFVRGFVETGLRTQIMVFQDADQDVEGFRDNIRDDNRFQWLVFRIGVRLYF